MEVLASESACPSTEVEVGFLSTRTKTYLVSGGNYPGVTNLQNFVNSIFAPTYNPESSANGQGFTVTGTTPIKEFGCNGQIIYLDPSEVTTDSVAFGPVTETPPGSGDLHFTATVVIRRKDAKGMPCPP